MRLSKCVVTILLAAPIFGSDSAPVVQAGVRVHEWGTFTSVAGEDGSPQPWMPLTAPSDLPCFVNHLAGQCIKCAPGELPRRPSTVATSTVRMETPVLYFYAPRRTNLSVHVDFPQGWITEWYPHASVVLPELSHWDANALPAVGKGRIEWNSVDVLPGADLKFPTGEGASHYYAARHTDASPLLINGQTEKLLFYRGIANMGVPLWVKVTADGKLELRNTSQETLPLAIVFENRGGKTGYRLVPDLRGSTTIETPALSDNPENLKQDFAAALVSNGLYEKEAQAMIETWRDSWFEDGMRVFYIMPRGTLDSTLPLTIEPAPAAIQRVFVGRVEVLSAELKRTLSTALSTGDTTAMAKYGRFLEPFAKQIPGGANASPAAAAFFQARYDDARRQVDSPACVR
jgi:hypothetical protein